MALSGRVGARKYFWKPAKLDVLHKWRRCVTRHFVNDTLTIRLDEELVRALDDEARKSGLSKGQIAREALKARLERSSKLTVMKRRFGIAAGPADLSANKEYRRDWKRSKK
jgi:predicted transcriptional regulator